MFFPALLLNCMVFSVAAQPQWFQLPAATAEAWDLVAHEQPGQWLIRPKAGGQSDDQILVLFAKASPAYDVAMEQILNDFSDRGLNVSFRLVNFMGRAEKGHAILDAAREEGISLIFAMGSQSTSFLCKNRPSQGIPVVTICSKDPVKMGHVSSSQGSGNRFAFTSLDVAVETQLAYIQQLFGQQPRIAIFYVATNMSAVRTQVEPFKQLCAATGIKVWDVAVTNAADTAQQLGHQVPLIMEKMTQGNRHANPVLFWVTGSSALFSQIEYIQSLADGVPLLSAVPNLVTSGSGGAVLSIGTSFENNAQLAGIYAAKILAGSTIPGDLPVGVVSPPDLAVNFFKAAEIGLKIPFRFFESASIIYDHRGRLVRDRGQDLLGAGAGGGQLP